MKSSTYLVTSAHTSEFPEPITFTRGTPLSVGERYDGPEAWDDWYFCRTPGQRGGWVPVQVIELIDETTGRAREDYTARELDVEVGEIVTSSRTLNGWAWCTKVGTEASGWVPLANLEETTG